MKNELAMGGGGEEIGAGLVDFAFGFGELLKADGFVLRFFVGRTAVGLNAFEFADGSVERTLQASLVERESRDGFLLAGEGGAFGEGGVDIGQAGIEAIDEVFEADSEEGVFDGSAATDAEREVDDVVDKVGFEVPTGR